MLLIKMKDSIKEYVVKEFLKSIMESLFIPHILKLHLLLLSVVLPLMLNIKFGIYVLKIQMKSKDSEKLLLHGLLMIISNKMIYLHQLLLNQLNLLLVHYHLLLNKISGHQHVMDNSNPLLILILLILKMDQFMNLLNLNMNLLKLLKHLMDKILMLMEISELSLIPGNMDKDLIMLIP